MIFTTDSFTVSDRMTIKYKKFERWKNSNRIKNEVIELNDTSMDWDDNTCFKLCKNMAIGSLEEQDKINNNRKIKTKIWIERTFI